MLDLHHLHTFQVLAATRSFTVAALRLGCSQATVTTHIQALERELGVALFVRWRFSRSVELTHVGESILTYSQRLLALAAETKAAAAREPQSPKVKKAKIP